MEKNNTDVRLEILKLLRLRDEQGGSELPDLEDLVRALEIPKREVRRACDALEATGHVEGAHGMGGDRNPSYFITNLGKAYLYEVEH